MVFLANAIFPAFFIPYLFVATTPWLIPIVIGIEWWFLFRANRDTPWLNTLSICVLANIGSSLAGVLLIVFLPYSFLPGTLAPTTSLYKVWILLSLPIFCALSTSIEGGVYLLLKKFIPFGSVWRPAVMGNITGYAVIVVFLIVWDIIHH